MFWSTLSFRPAMRVCVTEGSPSLFLTFLQGVWALGGGCAGLVVEVGTFSIVCFLLLSQGGSA